MTHTDVFFRALKEYKKALGNDGETTALRAAIARSDEKESVVLVRFKCSIEEDWVQAIEKGLVFIGKSIDEERQFILSRGEVQPIEKVKQVSKESVEHLARHSNLITHEQKGDDIMPDKLYTVERLTNYAVYENRFLYMLLNMIKDFVSLRYNNIVRLSNRYNGTLRLNKNVSSGKRRMNYEFTFSEERDDDPYIIALNSARGMLRRLEDILSAVHYYLNTPLMIEVAKADKLKPPITKTNPLRMDKNLKETVVLYEFLMSYSGDGYTITREEHKLNPVSERVAGDFAELAMLASFMTYEYSLGIEEELKKNFECEEQRRREAERAKLEEQLASLRGRIKENGGAEAYILALEKKNRILQDDTERLGDALDKVSELNGIVSALNGEIEKYAEEISALNEAHAARIAEYDARLDEQMKKLADEMTAHAADVFRAEEQKREEIARITEENARVLRERDERFFNKSREADEVRAALEQLRKQKTISDARLNALRQKYGLIGSDEDFSSEEAFSELESELEALGELVRGEWKSAKQLLRRDFISSIKEIIKGKHKKSQRVEAQHEDVACASETIANAAEAAAAAEVDGVDEPAAMTGKADRTELSVDDDGERNG